MHFKVGPKRAAVPDFPECEAIFVPQIADLPVGCCREAVALDAAERGLQALRYIFAAVVSDDEAAARNEIHKALKGGLHCLQIIVNICVVELDVSENQRIGEVVQKLWT